LGRPSRNNDAGKIKRNGPASGEKARSSMSQNSSVISRLALILNAELLEFGSRRARARDLAREIEGVNDLACGMVRQPDALQRRFVELAFDLCRAGSAGISMLEEGERGEPLFRWTALAGEFARFDSTRHTWRNGRGRPARWPNLEEAAQMRRTRVILAAAHLDHDPSNNRLRNLKSLCQRCHLIHDLPHHLARAVYLRSGNQFASKVRFAPDSPLEGDSFSRSPV
jgi:hypothetical protein